MIKYTRALKQLKKFRYFRTVLTAILLSAFVLGKWLKNIALLTLIIYNINVVINWFYYCHHSVLDGENGNFISCINKWNGWFCIYLLNSIAISIAVWTTSKNKYIISNILICLTSTQVQAHSTLQLILNQLNEHSQNLWPSIPFLSIQEMIYIGHKKETSLRGLFFVSDKIVYNLLIISLQYQLSFCCLCCHPARFQ